MDIFCATDAKDIERHIYTLQVNDLILLELVIQKHYSSKQMTWFYWVFGHVGIYINNTIYGFINLYAGQIVQLKWFFIFLSINCISN